jgi:hypothetical protein
MLEVNASSSVVSVSAVLTTQQPHTWYKTMPKTKACSSVRALILKVMVRVRYRLCPAAPAAGPAAAATSPPPAAGAAACC